MTFLIIWNIFSFCVHFRRKPLGQMKECTKLLLDTINSNLLFEIRGLLIKSAHGLWLHVFSWWDVSRYLWWDVEHFKCTSLWHSPSSHRHCCKEDLISIFAEAVKWVNMISEVINLTSTKSVFRVTVNFTSSSHQRFFWNILCLCPNFITFCCFKRVFILSVPPPPPPLPSPR